MAYESPHPIYMHELRVVGLDQLTGGRNDAYPANV